MALLGVKSFSLSVKILADLGNHRMVPCCLQSGELFVLDLPKNGQAAAPHHLRLGIFHEFFEGPTFMPSVRASVVYFGTVETIPFRREPPVGPAGTLVPERDPPVMRMILLLPCNLGHGKCPGHRLAGGTIDRPQIGFVGLVNNIGGEGFTGHRDTDGSRGILGKANGQVLGLKSSRA